MNKSPIPWISRPNRRDAIRIAGTGIGWAASGWFRRMERAVAQEHQHQRHCVILWMSGGPSQVDTFDMKPKSAHRGEFREIATSVPGIRISEHLPGIAKWMDRLAIVRGISTNEGDHGRGTYLVRTGENPGGLLKYPTLGASLSKALGNPSAMLPNYFSMAPSTGVNPDAFRAGFLGPRYEAATVSAVPAGNEESAESYANLVVDNFVVPEGISEKRFVERRELWRELQTRFLDSHEAEAAVAQDTVYRRAFRMMDAGADEAFRLADEADTVREAYGRGVFGQSCLVARRLIERGVPLVEVTLGGESGSLGWDNHQNLFADVKRLSGELDAGWSTLMTELDQRGLLDQTTILWIGEFGRTPQINSQGGRDHFPTAWSCVLGGGGIQGGQAYGATSPDGMEVVDNKVGIQEILATVCRATGVDPAYENESMNGRPVKIVDAKPIDALLM